MLNPVSSQGQPITVLYEDPGYIAFEKPAGFLVVPTPKKEKYTLTSVVNSQYVQAQQDWHLHPCHRLDRDTSGVILYAKGKKNQDLMMEEFKNRRVHKEYIAFVHGRLRNPKGEIRNPIQDFESRKFHRKPQGQSALTRYKVLEVRKQYSVVQAEPVTGRTNQIRIHFAQIGNPVVGERKYAFGRDYALKFRRVALHAKLLSWTSPIDHKLKTVQSDLPKDMEVFRARH
jgi:23S rRNA pseudouridine1911/1915/1917 synthase